MGVILKTWLHPNIRLWGILVLILAIGLLLAGVDSARNPAFSWGSGWLAYSILLSVAALCLFAVIRVLKADRQAILAALVAFVLRLAVGLALMLLLPVAGYQTNEATLAGYVYKDAYIRDRQAYDIADFGYPILSAFDRDPSHGDQYGGLLGLSAAIYRYVTPHAHRPYLIIILTALMAGLGTIFLWGASKEWFGERVALAATWIFAIYPESVLLGSSQMREPFVLAGIAIAFYSLVQMNASHSTQRRSWVGWLALAAVILFLFQPPVGLAAFAALFLAWLLDPDRESSWRRLVVYLAILVVGVLMVFIIWANLPALQGNHPGNIFFSWLQHNFNFQSYLAIRGSGILQKLVRNGSDGLKLLVVLGYGFTQPVLPAAMVVPAGSWIWWLINIFRSAGWYLLAPFLIYALFTSLRLKGQPRRYQLIWLSLLVWFWIFLSAANAGGDQWDNPRYRAIMLVFEALLAGWAIEWARTHRDVWLVRWLLVELACVLVFTDWYLGREVWPVLNLGIQPTILLAVSLSVFILLGSWLMDRRKSKT
jgi:4-amino-4-deoxy-L-arabinose transferase-like glycosyltransferase